MYESVAELRVERPCRVAARVQDIDEGLMPSLRFPGRMYPERSEHTILDAGC